MNADKKILITGASGFIGGALARALCDDYKVTGLYHSGRPVPDGNINWERADLLCGDDINRLLEKHSPETIIHCGAIAHQGLFRSDRKTYFDVNSIAAEKIAETLIQKKSSTRFIFLSSISVYGEINLSLPVDESHACRPSSDYGESKLDAEHRLLGLYPSGTTHKLTILRLAPVYDKDWSFNLDRRVLLPFNLAYVKYGSGDQQISALARPNLVDFIRRIVLDELNDDRVGIYNVTDHRPYSFKTIIDAFLQSSSHPDRPVIGIPLPMVTFITRMMGRVFPGKKEWLHGCYEKLASSLIFDNKKMLETGFCPTHNLHTVFYEKG